MGGRGASGARGGGGDARNWSMTRVGRLNSGNRPGMTVAQEYREKEILGNYSANDQAVARAAGYKDARSYQEALTKDIGERGLLNPVYYSETDHYLSEGYHRYAAMRQLGRRTIPVRTIY